jgi:uncharacterized repeat protein (TIGR03803 family)
MTELSSWKKVSVVFALCCVTAIASPAQTFTIVASFDGTDGAWPVASLIQGPDGNFYTTASEEGGYCFDCGTVVRVTPAGVITRAHAFDGADGLSPLAGLTLTVNGNGYGTTSQGGSSGEFGTVFKILPGGRFTTIYNFVNGGGTMPHTALTAAADGSLYGTTLDGGKYSSGTVFKITPDGVLTTLHQFNGIEGGFPLGALIQAADGMFYGTASGEGAGTCHCGTVFRMSPSGTLTTVHIFQGSPNDGAYPEGGLVQGSDGNLYGTTSKGGTDGVGTVFKIATDGTFTLLHSFSYNDGEYPMAGLIQATDGNFYGTTFEQGPDQGGTVFSISPNGVFTVVYPFNGPRDASQSLAALFQGTNGILYGTTTHGGTFGAGTVYSLDVGLAPFVSFVISSGKVGQTVGILGQGFTDTTSVSFNGTPAVYKVVCDTYLTATVPPGATTGFVTVVTPSGTLTSNVPFRVLP